MACLSIPRDLRVDIPGRGSDKINAAYAFGGADARDPDGASADRPPDQPRRGRRLRHVRGGHRRLGGVTIDVPAPILSNKFECPLRRRTRCARWKGGASRKGEQHMDGRRALDLLPHPRRTSSTRPRPTSRAASAAGGPPGDGGRDRQLRDVPPLPFIGDDLVTPLATDLVARTSSSSSAGWRSERRRAAELRCRLGGQIADIDGQSLHHRHRGERLGHRDGQGESAPQPPPPGSGPFGPGCRVGRSG